MNKPVIYFDDEAEGWALVVLRNGEWKKVNVYNTKEEAEQASREIEALEEGNQFMERQDHAN